MQLLSRRIDSGKSTDTAFLAMVERAAAGGRGIWVFGSRRAARFHLDDICYRWDEKLAKLGAVIYRGRHILEFPNTGGYIRFMTLEQEPRGLEPSRVVIDPDMEGLRPSLMSQLDVWSYVQMKAELGEEDDKNGN